MRRLRKTNEQFLDEIYELVGDEYTVLSEYQGAVKQVKFRHNKCGREYSVQARVFLSGSRCRKCARRKTQAEFVKEVKDLVGNEYSVLGKYDNADTKIKMKHNICAHEYDVRPYEFLSGKRCPECMRPNYNRDTIQFRKEVNNVLGNDYVVLGNYKGYNKAVLMKHKKCGMKYEKTPTQTLTGVGCPFCNMSGIKTQEIFDYQVKQQVGDEYTFLEPYKKNQIKMKVVHNKCGHLYHVTPNNFLQGFRCPNCIISKGESRIRDYLLENNYRFEREYTFSDCAYKYKLRFDFAVFDEDKLITLIEYDGIQHYEPVEKFGGKEGFKVTRIRDKIKSEYCKEKNIRLIRIPYYEKEIEIKLDNELNSVLSTC